MGSVVRLRRAERDEQDRATRQLCDELGLSPPPEMPEAMGGGLIGSRESVFRDLVPGQDAITAGVLDGDKRAIALQALGLGHLAAESRELVLDAYVAHRRRRVAAGQPPLDLEAWIGDCDHPEAAELLSEARERCAEENRTRRVSVRLGRIHQARLTERGLELVACERFDRNAPAIRAVTAWLEGGRPLLTMVGNAGVGKTVAAAVALAELGGRYVKGRYLADASIAAFGKDHDAFEAWVHCEGVLVVDDIGAAGGSRSERESAAIFEAVDERLRSRTILISNLSEADFEAYLDATAVDRIVDAGEVHTIEGKSRRGQEPPTAQDPWFRALLERGQR